MGRQRARRSVGVVISFARSIACASDHFGMPRAQMTRHGSKEEQGRS